jgi:uncharacterized cupin superfamily protein
MSDEGWFVVNATEATWHVEPRFGRYTAFEREGAPFPDFGINIRVIEPGQTSTMYHAEDGQEGFLVLSGECLLLVDGEEHRLRAWDYFHCPAGTPHGFVGAGDGPCAILMVGARYGGEEPPVRYVADATAARHDAAVAEDTTSPAEAYPGRVYHDVSYLPGSLPGA